MCVCVCVSPWPSQPSDLGFEVGEPAPVKKNIDPRFQHVTLAARDSDGCVNVERCVFGLTALIWSQIHMSREAAWRADRTGLLRTIQHRRAYWSQPFSTHSNASVGCRVLPKVKWFLKELLATRSEGGGRRRGRWGREGEEGGIKRKERVSLTSYETRCPCWIFIFFLRFIMMMTSSHFKTTYEAENYDCKRSSSLFVLLVCDTLSQQWWADGGVRENQWKSALSRRQDDAVHRQILQL